MKLYVVSVSVTVCQEKIHSQQIVRRPVPRRLQMPGTIHSPTEVITACVTHTRDPVILYLPPPYTLVCIHFRVPVTPFSRFFLIFFFWPKFSLGSNWDSGTIHFPYRSVSDTLGILYDCIYFGVYTFSCSSELCFFPKVFFVQQLRWGVI